MQAETARASNKPSSSTSSSSSTTSSETKHHHHVVAEEKKHHIPVETPQDKLEDKVIEENHLPETTSAKHEEIRKKVTEELKKKKDNNPIELAPLYFTFAEDEFSVVDMEPFLIAVEYALQGKIILIEGHTDNVGKDDYNVQLSIKRVKKIRELMLAMGVPDDHISIVGYGEEVSKHDNKTTEGRQKNRRVDFKAY